MLPLLTRLLDPTEYGVVATALVVQALLGILASGGLPDAVVRAFFVGGRGPEDARTLVGITLLVAAVVASVAALTGPWWSGIFSELDYDTELKIATWTSVGVAGVLAIQGLLRSQQRPGAFVVVVGLTSLGAQVSGVGLVILWGGADSYLGGIAIGYAIALLVGLAFIRGVRVARPAPGVVRTAFLVGLPIVPHSLALYVMSAGDRIIIESLEGVASVGRYHLAYVTGSLGFILIQAVNQAWAPVIYGAGDDRRWQVLADTASSLARLAALLGGALAIGAPVVLYVLAPADYGLEDLNSIALVVAAATVPMLFYIAHTHPLFWLARTRTLAIATPVAAGLNIGLNLALVPALGLVGAAWATLAAITLQALLVAIVSRRVAPVPWRDRTFALAALVLGGLCLVGAVQPTDGAWLAIRALEATALGIGVGLLGLRAVRTARSAEAS